MRRALLTTSGVGAGLGLLYIIVGRQYPLGSAGEPGPGFFPALAGVLLVVSSVGTGLEAWLHGVRGAVDWPRGQARRRLLLIVAALLGYVVLLPWAGYHLTSTLVMVVVLRVMGVTRWPLSIGVALGLAFASYYGFAVLLGVPLPLGSWVEGMMP